MATANKFILLGILVLFLAACLGARWQAKQRRKVILEYRNGVLIDANVFYHSHNNNNRVI